MSQGYSKGTFTHKLSNLLVVSLQQSNGFQNTTAMGMDQTGDNTANLKGKLSNLNETARQLTENLNVHKKEVQILRSEKETLESVLTMKCQDTRKALTNELHRVVEDVTRHYSNMTAESQRLQQQLSNLKTDKTALEKEVLRMTKRIEELELQIGQDDETLN